MRAYLIIICTATLLLSACASISTTSRSNNIEDALVNAVDQAFTDVGRESRIAVIHIQTPNNDLNNYLLGELQHILVGRKFNVVDRTDLDKIRKEQNFQYSLEVDDNTAVSLGKFVGADLVVTGRIDGQDSYRRLRLKVLDTETAIIRGTGSVAYSEVERQNEYRQTSPYDYSYGYGQTPPTTPKTTSRTSSGLSFKLYGGGVLNAIDGGSDDKDNVSGTLGWDAGLSFDIYLWQTIIMLEPGVRYITKGYEMKTEPERTETNSFEYIDVFAKGKLELPLGKNVTIQPNIGYGAGILLNALSKNDNPAGNTNNNDGEKDITSDSNSLIFSLLFGADFVIGDKFVIGLEFDQGMTSLWKDKDDKKFINSYLINMGLRF